MKKIFIIFIAIFTLISLPSCKTVSKKIDETTEKEGAKLSKWLNQSETELKISLGKPDKIEFKDNRNRYYLYVTEKYKIKCERKFEINPNNVVVGFSSKNCF